jgi:peptidoglycan/LPS O-acetylase OafA/YrhL
MLTKKAPSSSLYFPNLNALRFIAASLVIVHHIEQLRYYFGLSNLWYNTVIRNLGSLGVLLFFVLSGFLITSLLMKEKEVSGTISVGKFYMRRVLRIWPLYLLVVIGSLFIIPLIPSLAWPGFGRAAVWKDLGWRLMLFIVLLPNVSQNVFGIVPYAGQTWTIAAEEQFYLVWPVLMKKKANKWVLVLATILIYIIVVYVLYAFHVDQGTGFLKIFYGYWISTPIECLAIGAAYALIVKSYSGFILQLKKILFTRWVQWLALLLSIAVIASGMNMLFARFVACAILFGVVIVNLAANPARIINLEWAPLRYLGKISYGIYMYHSLMIELVLKTGFLIHYTGRFFIYPASFLFAILIASISYRYFETPFLRKKKKYTKVLSGG